jgi:hypothetical protein
MAEFELREVLPIEATNVTPVQVPQPMQMIDNAVRAGASMDTLEKLFALQERYEANEARKQYVAALAAFKAQGLRVHKDRTVSQGAGRPTYKHATLSNIIETIAPALADHGLSATWSTSQEPHGITVTCILRHAAGHMESVSLTGQPDAGPGRNNIQAIGSTITYLQRYTLMAITGVAASDQDDDGTGNNSAAHYVTNEQAAEITELLHETNSDFEGFLRWIKAESIATIRRADFRKVMAALEAKRAQA